MDTPHGTVWAPVVVRATEGYPPTLPGLRRALLPVYSLMIATEPGGYVGDGVAAANLAGRCLAALITGTERELTALPWVGHSSRRWEPEPLRWLGVNVARWLAAGADRVERRWSAPRRDHA